MLDDAFTYGGGVLGFAALGAWLWLAVRAVPTFEAFVRGFDDELHLGRPRDSGRTRLRHALRQAAVALTAVAALCLSIACAIPD
ncbi:hypothetical protein Q8W71_31025 [Methylobacterium sp. NEAU 140]|uniref:hypothetical protein n=1 Tax=Methylobacterium sp. NEAU 140 TaxID=3064945 RepID=UPI0027361923|nr:hypothetical protein [Methylobacterium sp. NEAU 140]MDP4027025.1 hypothetical protein [Methylobacterium sp. NEAU 140]